WSKATDQPEMADFITHSTPFQNLELAMKSDWQIENLKKYREKRQRERFAEAVSSNPPIVAGRLNRCPNCRSSDHVADKILENSDAVHKSKRHCKSCGAKFIQVLD